MSTYVTGRTLDERGDPVPGTGFDVEAGGWLERRLRERTGPVTYVDTITGWSPGVKSFPGHWQCSDKRQWPARPTAGGTERGPTGRGFRGGLSRPTTA